jgi:hypothetical protein
MHLYYADETNVAVPLLYPGNDQYTRVSFTADDLLTVPTYQDDTLPLPNYAVVKNNRWSVCTTHPDFGYTYPTLSWVLDKHSPQYPTCHSVKVVRNFI